MSVSGKNLDILNELIEALKSLAESHYCPESEAPFLRVLERLFRRNYMNILAINQLSDEVAYGDAMLALLRRTAEDMISIDWMSHMGGDAMAVVFHEHIHMQVWLEMEYLKKMGLNPQELYDKKIIEETKDNYSKHKNMYKHPKSGQTSHSWAGMSSEEMLLKLKKDDVLSKRDYEVITWAYTMGSWKIHTNPYDAMGFMGNEANALSTKASYDASIRHANYFLIRIAAHYMKAIGEVCGDKTILEIAKKVKNIKQKVE